LYKKISKEIILILLMAAYLIIPASKSVVQLSQAQPNQDMQAVLDVHNRERAAVEFPLLMWSNSLAADSRSWANHLATLGIVCGRQGCNAANGVSVAKLHGAANENMAFGPVFPADLGRTSPAEYAQMWADEKVKYDAGQRSGLGIGHYTAMVWKNTREVGCGFVAGAVPDEQGLGGGTDILVCRYNPPGNSPTGGPSNLPNYSVAK
jgi:hypothetical protein